MEVTLTEVILFAWAMLATAQWLQTRDELKHHRMMAGEILMRIADGRIKAVKTEDSFELEEVLK
jgi:hypothetical protein